MKVTVAKALKIKNEIVGEMKSLQALIQSNNSREKSAVNKFDVMDLFLQYGDLFARLVAVKTAIQKANAGIAEDLVSLAEVKSQISFLRSIPTEEGKTYMEAGYREPAREVEKVAVIDCVKQRDLIRIAEKSVRDIQDRIDTYNATTHIVIPDET